MMILFTNSVLLRGFLGKNAEAPPSDGITEDAFAVLLLATVSGKWDLGSNQWIPRTDWHRIICPGPFFCGMVRGMRRGDYLEVEGELRALEQERGVVVAGERFPVKHSTYAVHAIRIRRLDRPEALVDYGDSDDDNREVQP
jgi:acetamidase/formamidase